MNNTQLKYGVPSTKVADFLVFQRKRIYAKTLNIALSLIMDPCIIAANNIRGSYHSHSTNFRFEFEHSSMLLNKSSTLMVLICKHKINDGDRGRDYGVRTTTQTEIEIFMKDMTKLQKVAIDGEDYLKMDRMGSSLILGFEEKEELRNIEREIKELLGLGPSNMTADTDDDSVAGDGSSDSGLSESGSESKDDSSSAEDSGYSGNAMLHSTAGNGS